MFKLAYAPVRASRIAVKLRLGSQENYVCNYVPADTVASSIETGRVPLVRYLPNIYRPRISMQKVASRMLVYH